MPSPGTDATSPHANWVWDRCNEEGVGEGRSMPSPGTGVHVTPCQLGLACSAVTCLVKPSQAHLAAHAALHQVDRGLQDLSALQARWVGRRARVGVQKVGGHQGL